MDASTVEMEAAQLGLAQRAQRYENAAALKLVEVAAAGQPQAAQPQPGVPPIQPVSASPREGSTVHVIA
jgi:hypothetical protein